MMRLLGTSLKFIGGGILGGLLGVLLLVAVDFSTGGQQDAGPPPVIDPAAAKRTGAGGSVVRVHKIWNGRVLQRCRGACDVVAP